jgi:hypothetical protein
MAHYYQVIINCVHYLTSRKNQRLSIMNHNYLYELEDELGNGPKHCRRRPTFEENFSICLGRCGQ